ncbi:MAG: hypothetical protein WBN31_13330 [Gammaproteobacteria bacterium]
MKSFTVALGSAFLALIVSSYAPLAAAAPSCGDPGDPFAEFYNGGAPGKTWRITMVTHDHEDHGLHLTEGDTFTLKYNSNCEIVLAPGPNLALRWGNQSRLLARESRVAANLRSVENEVCTTIGIGHEDQGASEIVARPHLMRMKMIDTPNGRKLQIAYSHRARATDDCSSDGTLSNVHRGVAHAED